MSVALSRLAHRGPRAADRRQAVPATLRALEGRLAAGRTVMEGVANLFARHGCRGGILWLDGVTCDPMRYVLPALATDDLHAAFYSAAHAPEGRMRIGPSTASVGWRDGAAFLHCHGRWSGTGGPAMGHLLPTDSIVAEDVEVSGIGSPDAWFEGLPDAETHFTLFAPTGGGGGGGLLGRLRPDEDVCAAIAALCADHGIARARVHGLGSICEVRFEDGRHMACIATEARIDRGAVAEGRAVIDVSVVDVDGGIQAGRLASGLNPVGVTFELLIEARP